MDRYAKLKYGLSQLTKEDLQHLKTQLEDEKVEMVFDTYNYDAVRKLW